MITYSSILTQKSYSNYEFFLVICFGQRDVLMSELVILYVYYFDDSTKAITQFSLSELCK